jgi:hypothetical protein
MATSPLALFHIPLLILLGSLQKLLHDFMGIIEVVKDVFEIRMFGVVEFSKQLFEPPADGGVELVH